MIARQWAFFFSLSSSFEFAVNVCFGTDVITVSICFFPYYFSLPFPSPDPNARPIAVVFWVYAINPRTLRRRPCAAAFISVPLLITFANHLVAIFSDQLGAISGPNKSSRGKKVLLLCNMIRTHDVMMGPLF